MPSLLLSYLLALPAATLSLRPSPFPSLLAPLRSPLRSPPPSMVERRPSWQDEQAAPVAGFLCQRAAQTILFYANEFKNDFEKGWLLRFSEEHGVPGLCTQSGKMLHAHDAFEIAGVRWEEYVHSMLRMPDETHMIEVAIGGFRMGSPNNPYLKKQRQVRTYEDTLSPQKLARKLLTVRETLAREWQRDLKLVEADNEEIQIHRAEIVKNLVDLNQFHRQPVVPVETLEDCGSTPLRLSTFDLLKSALTRHAARRLLAELERDSFRRHEAEWFATFLRKHGSSLRGSTESGAAADFLARLMEQPLLVGTSLGGNPRFTDPLALAERLLELRVMLADEWVTVLEGVPTESEHLLVSLMRDRLPEIQVVERKGFGPKEPPPSAFSA